MGGFRCTQYIPVLCMGMKCTVCIVHWTLHTIRYIRYIRYKMYKLLRILPGGNTIDARGTPFIRGSTCLVRSSYFHAALLFSCQEGIFQVQDVEIFSRDKYRIARQEEKKN